LLVLVQKEVLRRVLFDMSFGGYLGEFGATSDVGWRPEPDFRVPFTYWRSLLAERRDTFLGYSSKSSGTAAAVKRYVESLGTSVLDWYTDFIPGHSIIEQIGHGARRCVGGVFLFTKDDDLADHAQADLAVPRDNVVFEAGYFVDMEGKHNVLAVREVRPSGWTIVLKGGWVFWSFVYLMLRSAMQLVLWRCRSEVLKKIEPLVLCHELEVLRRQHPRRGSDSDQHPDHDDNTVLHVAQG
jgi:hypothetical protein